MSNVELYVSFTEFILTQGQHVLSCSRIDGCMIPSMKKDQMEEYGPLVYLGCVYGCLGKIRFLPDSSWHLILITKCSEVGVFSNGDQVYRIDRVSLLPLSPQIAPLIESLELDNQPFDFLTRLKELAREPIYQNIVASHQQLIISCTPGSATNGSQSENKTIRKENNRKERFERRLHDTFLRMFNDTSNFYFCPNGDLTNSSQRRYSFGNKVNLSWDQIDDRFFWNKHMLNDLRTFAIEITLPWIFPVIQGYVEMATCYLDFASMPSLLTKDYTLPSQNERNSLSQEYILISSNDYKEMTEKRGHIVAGKYTEDVPKYQLILISRRNRYRAGTRYKRRGIDSTGAVANYVETELIIYVEGQLFSFVQVRGSIPVFWSQTGHRYRPRPVITQEVEVTQDAMKLHFLDQLSLYQHQCAINLVDDTGREAIVMHEFEDQLLTLNSPYLTYVFYNFKKHCKGLQYHKLQLLLEAIKLNIEQYKFFWVDLERSGSNEFLCEQMGTFRVNCMDCLDRTNVVQAMIARQVLEMMLMKLGMLMPDQSLPAPCEQAFRFMWANNGDAISRQYAGTVAMKGDYTRTGHRKIAGTLKDGFHSANRYYISQFKDRLRQAVIDLMQGVSEAEVYASYMFSSQGEDEIEDKDYLIEIVRELIIPPGFKVKGWVLRETEGYRCISHELEDEGCVVLILDSCVVVTIYDSDEDIVSRSEIIQLKDINKIEIGVVNWLKFTTERKFSFRIYFSTSGTVGFHYTFTSFHSRSDEIKADLQDVIETFKAATSKIKHYPPFVTCKISNKRSLPHNITNFDLDHNKIPQTIEIVKSSIIKMNSNVAHTRKKSVEVENFEMYNFKSASSDNLATIDEFEKTLKEQDAEIALQTLPIKAYNGSPRISNDFSMHALRRHRSDDSISQHSNTDLITFSSASSNSSLAEMNNSCRKKDCYASKTSPMLPMITQPNVAINNNPNNIISDQKNTKEETNYTSPYLLLPDVFYDNLAYDEYSLLDPFETQVNGVTSNFRNKSSVYSPCSHEATPTLRMESLTDAVEMPHETNHVASVNQNSTGPVGLIKRQVNRVNNLPAMNKVMQKLSHHHPITTTTTTTTTTTNNNNNNTNNNHNSNNNNMQMSDQTTTTLNGEANTSNKRYLSIRTFRNNQYERKELQTKRMQFIENTKLSKTNFIYL